MLQIIFSMRNAEPRNPLLIHSPSQCSNVPGILRYPRGQPVCGAGRREVDQGAYPQLQGGGHRRLAGCRRCQGTGFDPHRENAESSVADPDPGPVPF
jgi:hypothetical protein